MLWMYFKGTGHGLQMAGTIFQSQKGICLSRISARQFNKSSSLRTMTWSARQIKIGTSKNSDFQIYKRQFSLTSVSNIWLPWNSWSEPSVPMEGPSAEVSPTIIPEVSSATITPEVVSTVDATSLADTVGPMTDAVTGAIIDPPFIEMGLASSWWPNHFVHQIMEFTHLNTGLSWWSTIIIGTLLIRVATIPLYVYTRKYTINQSNHAEEMQKLVKNTQKYKYRDDMIRFNIARKKLKDFYKRTGTGPVRGFFANSSMSFLFITCVTAVRQMCAVPVPSLVEGGMLWFPDLSSADPYYVLPILTGATMGLIINIAVRGGTMQRSWTGVLRKVQYLPVFAMPLVFGSASSGIYLYWLTTSVFSLFFQRLLQLPAVRERLKFPTPKPVEAKDKAGAIQKFRDWKEDSYQQTEMKMQHKAIKRARKDREKQQKKALKGKPPITYTIGVDAIPAVQKKPDFEREWRPPKPKHFGLY